MGKLKYGYRKISCPKDAPPECAACEITHGGLHVNETAEWAEAKKELLKGGLAVVQSHRDEVGAEVRFLFFLNPFFLVKHFSFSLVMYFASYLNFIIFSVIFFFWIRVDVP